MSRYVSAFPNDGTWANGFPEPGVTIRDYFAAKALAGHLANPTTTSHPCYSREGLVNECYAMADAMLAAREARS